MAEKIAGSLRCELPSKEWPYLSRFVEDREFALSIMRCVLSSMNASVESGIHYSGDNADRARRAFENEVTLLLGFSLIGSMLARAMKSAQGVGNLQWVVDEIGLVAITMAACRLRKAFDPQASRNAEGGLPTGMSEYLILVSEVVTMCVTRGKRPEEEN